MNKQKIGLWMIYLIAAAMGITATFKIAGAEDGVELFGNAGAPYILAVVQLSILALLVMAKTRLLGVLLAASYIGGIIAFSWLHVPELPIVGIALNIILYVGAALHWPKLTTGSLD
ncbi:hypothetical protein [Neolewinella persica]|uniref:hypothetical protein n=1 Tax=Neolewinella persica TaxID=70998 RepID=UPI000378EDAD|nr:hypothetical protein [Neolewinella persica]